MKVANVTMLKKIKIELLPNRLVPQVTSSDPEGATIFIQLGTCPDNLVNVNDCTSLWWWQKKYEGTRLSGQQDDDYLAGKMIDLVCVLPLRELAVEQRHIFVRLVLQNLGGALKSESLCEKQCFEFVQIHFKAFSLICRKLANVAN